MIKIFATGRIVRDPKVFTYSGDKSGVSFSIASNDRGSEKAEFLDCVMFNRDEKFSKYLGVGDQVIVTGRFSRNDKNYVSCIVDDLEFGSKKMSGGTGSSSYNSVKEDSDYVSEDNIDIPY